MMMMMNDDGDNGDGDNGVDGDDKGNCNAEWDNLRKKEKQKITRKKKEKKYE